MTSNFFNKKPQLHLIISGEFAVQQLYSVNSAEAKFWRPHI